MEKWLAVVFLYKRTFAGVNVNTVHKFASGVLRHQIRAQKAKQTDAGAPGRICCETFTLVDAFTLVADTPIIRHAGDPGATCVGVRIVLL